MLFGRDATVEIETEVAAQRNAGRLDAPSLMGGTIGDGDCVTAARA